MNNVQKLPRIYFDTNIWIELSRVAKGKNNDPSCKKLYSELLYLRDSNKILIPFSSFNYYEIIKNNNELQRKEMVDFMADISKGWHFKPIDKYLKHEIENACRKKLNINEFYNVSYEILSNSTDSIINGSVEVIPKEGCNTTKELQEEAQKIWDDHVKDPNIMKQMLKQREPRMLAKIDAEFVDLITKDIEKTRQNSYGFSKEVFDKITKVKYITESLGLNLTKFCHKNKISFKELFTNEKELEILIESMPALNIFVKLNSIRDKESPQRKVQRNDYYDIWHYATGLAYADIMIGEKMFVSISKRQKLDEKNNCSLFTSLNEIAAYDIQKILKL